MTRPAAKKAADKVIDKSKDLAHSEGKKMEERGKRNSGRIESRRRAFDAMKTFKLVLPILICAVAACSYAQTPDATVAAPDYTKVNKRDRSAGEPTADQQKANATDRELTRKIRRSIVADKSLSTYAHNVKIISQNGAVTLKGPVRSDDEKKSVVAKAVAITGSADTVTDQISVSNREHSN